jgi:multiple sugar transport system substrate-binding protein
MKPVSLVLAAGITVLAAVLTGCGGKKPAEELFSGEPGGEITVSAYESYTYRNFLEEAARGFEALHPGTRINVETFSAMPEIRTVELDGAMVSMFQMPEDAPAESDYISRVNTRLMSGEGADVYAMDVLPVHKFVESGQLENLEAYMDGDGGFNRGDYRENILEALRYRDGIWFLPLDYSFNYFAYDSVLLPDAGAAGFGTGKTWTTAELLALGERYYDGSARVFNIRDYSPGGGLARLLLRENIQTFVDFERKRVNFTDGGFAGLLESVRRAGEQGYVPRGVTGQEDAAALMLQQAGEEPTERFFFKWRSNYSLVLQLINRETGNKSSGWGGDEVRAVEDDDEIAGIAANAGGGVPFTYSQAYGISSGSKNKALAWAFIKYLLSEDIQLSPALQWLGLPLNNKAREQKAEDDFSRYVGGYKEMEMFPGLLAALEKYRAITEELSDQIDSFTVLDTAVIGMITSEMDYYFTGARTAAEVAAVLQNKVDLYINE